jgi:hypothetical protein
MITLPDTVVKEAKSLQDCIKRGQFNTNILLSFLKTITDSKQVRHKEVSASKKEMHDHYIQCLTKGRITKFKKNAK